MKVVLKRPSPLPAKGTLQLAAQGGDLRAFGENGEELSLPVSVDLASPFGGLAEIVNRDVVLHVAAGVEAQDAMVTLSFTSEAGFRIWTDEFHCTTVNTTVTGGFSPGSVQYCTAQFVGDQYYVAGALSADSPLQAIVPVPTKVYDAIQQNPLLEAGLRHTMPGGGEVYGHLINDAYFQTVADFWQALGEIFGWSTITAEQLRADLAQRSTIPESDLSAGKYMSTRVLDDAGSIDLICFIEETVENVYSTEALYAVRRNLEAHWPGTMSSPGTPVYESAEEKSMALLVSVNEDRDEGAPGPDNANTSAGQNDDDIVQLSLKPLGISRGIMVLSVTPDPFSAGTPVRLFRPDGSAPLVPSDCTVDLSNPQGALADIASPQGVSIPVEGLVPHVDVSFGLSYSTGGVQICGQETALLSLYRLQFSETAPCSGFDDTDAPPWLMVPTSNPAFVANTLNVVIEPAQVAPMFYFSVDPNPDKPDDVGTAIVTPTQAQQTSLPQVLTIEGTSGGYAVLNARIGAPLSQFIAGMVNLRIRNRLPVSVDFHYMSDIAGHTTTRMPGDEMSIIADLNDIWTKQANIVFTIGIVDSRVVPVDVGATPSPPGNDPNCVWDWIPGGDPLFHDDAEDVTAFHLDGPPDVFFVWEYETENPEDQSAGTIGGEWILVEDDLASAPISVVLGHEMGHYFGITPADYRDAARSDELMYYAVSGCKLLHSQVDPIKDATQTP